MAITHAGTEAFNKLRYYSSNIYGLYVFVLSNCVRVQTSTGNDDHFETCEAAALFIETEYLN